MQGNDLGSHWSKKFVVIDVPTLFERPDPTYRVKLGGRLLGKREPSPTDYVINRNMVAWIANIGRTRNIPTEVWTFIQDEEIVDRLARKLDRYAGNAIVGYQTWEEETDALLELRIDPSIHTVYDADPDRVERLWGMRGHRVLRGGAPTS